MAYQRKTPRFKWGDCVEMIGYPKSPLLKTPRYYVLGSAEKTWHGLWRFHLSRSFMGTLDWYAYEDELKRAGT
jgi:hypothetical protein